MAIDKEKFNSENFKAQFTPKREKLEEGIRAGSNGSGYAYIAKLLCHPIADGRHRILWLVVAPYVATILKLSDENKLDMAMKYFEECNKLNPCTEVLSIVEQYVNYASDIGLRPLLLETMRESDPDLYSIVTTAIGENQE